MSNKNSLEKQKNKFQNHINNSNNQYQKTRATDESGTRQDCVSESESEKNENLISSEKENEHNTEENSSSVYDFKNENSTVNTLAKNWVSFVEDRVATMKACEQYMQDAEKAEAKECAKLFQKAYEADSAQLADVKKHLAQILETESNHVA